MKYTFRTFRMMLAIGACIFVTNAAFAAPVLLPPGSSNVSVPQADTFAADVGTGYTVLGTYVSTVSNASGDLSVTLYADAIKTSGGAIDIVYQVFNSASSTANVDSFSVLDYSNVPNVAVAGLSDATPPTGTNFHAPTSPPNSPNLAQRNVTPGSTITFTMSTIPGQDLLPGQYSALTLVQTTAVNWDSFGSAAAASLSTGVGSVAFNNVPEVNLNPAPSPEPSSLVLGGLALIFGAGVVGFRRLRHL